jgi:hypothetical protein
MMEISVTLSEAPPDMADTDIDMPTLKPAPSGRAPSVPAKYDEAAGIVTLGHAGYEFDTLPAAVKRSLGLRGLADVLRGAMHRNDPGKAYAALVAGGLSTRAPKAAKELDPWRQAFAVALAEETVKAAGGKIRDKGRETPEYAVALDDAKQAATRLTRDGLTAAKKRPAVVAAYDRLVGAETGSLAALVAA